MTSPIEAEKAALEHRAEQLEEYGQFVAVAPIMFGNALAYDVDHPVPASAVETYGYEKQHLVKRVATAAQARTGAKDQVAEEAPPTAAEDSSEPNTGRTRSNRGS